MKNFTVLIAPLLLVACGGPDEPAEPPAQESAQSSEQRSEPEAAAPTEAAARADIDTVLAAQPDEVRQRYRYRKPKETLEFFGIEPGMTVVEVLPGGGWYTNILLPYLGEDGRLIGADYPYQIWVVNPSVSEERREEKKTWVESWTQTAEGWREPGDASVAAFQLGDMPAEFEGTADAVLFVRAMHNLARWDDEADTLTTAITDAYNALKPGGIVGIIQHEARPDMPDDWASGGAGYLKRDFVVERMEAAGFELVESSEMHVNPDDQPTTDDAVWRLPPGLAGSDDDPERRAAMEEIGESNRMTLKFRKPSD